MTDLTLEIPPFTLRVRSPFASVARHLEFFYPDAVRRPRGSVFVDFDLALDGGRGVRRWWRPQSRFLLDADEPFFPLPAAQAAPMLEWGLNWCVAHRPLGYLVMHAAVLAQGDRAVMLPGFPGAGKSTLCASLALCDGWRLLSDELAILDPGDGMLLPHPRPISVKNASIDIARAMPGSRIGPVFNDTRKGDVAHVACPSASVAAARERARVAWVVFPKFDASALPRCEEVSRAEAFALISEQSFNRERMGARGFHALCALLDGARCFEIGYRSTDEGLAAVRSLCRRP